MIYTHIARHGVAGVTSPLDLLADVDPEALRAALDATRRLGEMGEAAARPDGR
jgi:hypothetical protein